MSLLGILFLCTTHNCHCYAICSCSMSSCNLFLLKKLKHSKIIDRHSTSFESIAYLIKTSLIKIFQFYYISKHFWEKDWMKEFISFWYLTLKGQSFYFSKSNKTYCNLSFLTISFQFSIFTEFFFYRGRHLNSYWHFWINVNSCILLRILF